MNSLLYYYNNVQKMAAYRQAKRMQRGAMLGYGEPISSATKVSMPSGAYIGTSDFSIEYYGNSVGSIGNVNYFISTVASVATSAGIQMWNRSTSSVNGVDAIRMGNNSDGSSNIFYPNWKSDDAAKFHLVLTRSQTNIRLQINNETFEYETKDVLDLGNLQLVISNSSDVGFVRVWNYALSADEIATLDNNGDPMGYVVPKAMRNGLLAEYLPHNLMYGRDDKTIATSWLDSAKQLPLSDEYMEPLFQSIGGYDMAANGSPKILFSTYNYLGVFTAQGGFSIMDPALLQVPCTIQSVFVPRVFGSTQTVFDTCGSNIAPRIDISDTGTIIPYYGGSSSARTGEVGKLYNITFVISETEQSAYFNGTFISTRTFATAPFPHYIIGSLMTQFLYKFQGDYLLHRHFNYALSEDEVKALNNNGDPVGYVLPAAMKTGDQRCIAEYLAMNLVAKENVPTVAAKWLDSATVLPNPDGTLRRIWESVGGHDMEAYGNPIILQ